MLKKKNERAKKKLLKEKLLKMQNRALGKDGPCKINGAAHHLNESLVL